MTAVLLLNASYEPLSVIPNQRAIALWLRGRVEAATDEAVPIRGGSQTLHLPTVLRLRRYVNVPQRGARWSRISVLRRDHYTCIYCGAQPGVWKSGRVLMRTDFTLDHIIPRSRGGLNSWGNTACACPLCNQRKGDRTPHEAGMKMLWEPKTPRVNYWVFAGDIPEAWKIYLEL